MTGASAQVRVSRTGSDVRARYRLLHNLTQTQSVPNGGYVGSVLLSAVRAHFGGPLAHLDQPDTMSMQLQFLRRTRAGPGTVSVEHLKLGGSVSTVQVILSQGDRREVQGYIVQTNFAKQTGLTLPTGWLKSSLTPAPPPIDFTQLEKSGEDANWLIDRDPPKSSFRRASRHVVFHHPKQRPDLSTVDQWLRFRPGGPGSPVVPFPQEALGFVVDIFPHMAEFFPQVSGRGTRWYPTVALNLDVKRNLPAEGADWLFVRVRAGEIRNGRMDLQILVLDRAGDLVAISSHISLVMSSERNLAASRQGDSGKL